MSTSKPEMNKLCYTIAVLGGEGSQALPVGMADKLLQLIVIPPNENVAYQFYITESLDNLTIFKRDDEVVGTLNEVFTNAVVLYGDHTCYITNASADGNFKVRLVYE